MRKGFRPRLPKNPPWELKLLGYTPEPWRIEDTITLSRMVGYLTLSQSQAEVERLIMEMIQAGVFQACLEELFPGRIVSDLATDECRSHIAGGPSDRRFSKWYVSDLRNWRQGTYKTLSISDSQAKTAFTSR